ncbi:hypothetical protein GALMADRAFT_232001 [Galerina marginata CBS 339.88]|uniref:UV excision repair protein RAD23 n=1 Tax=Galerina marginata (strain CBS 339.88) TaxID=685588 RepID=A0A067S9P9_GALM3|nr:hypothetical protein GALMADRAFT_232001 [Galerina marginata CBS 339.88]
MATKITIKDTRKEDFQVDITPGLMVGELKAKINTLKGYALETQKLIHSARVLKDDQTLEASGVKENDTVVLLISKAQPPIATSATIESIQHTDTPSEMFPSPKGKEVIRYNAQTSKELPVTHRPEWAAPSPLAHSVPQPQPSSSSLSAWQPPSFPSSSKQNHGQMGAEADKWPGTPGGMDDFASMIRTNPSMRQRFLETAKQHDPAFGQQLSQNPALLDSLLASAQADLERPTLQNNMLNPEDKESVQRIMDLGFDEKQVIEAYLVSDKNQEVAINYLVNTNTESASDANEDISLGQSIRDPLFRERLTQSIARTDPAMAERIKANPLPFEMALQQTTLQKSVLTPVENSVVDRLVEFGFDRQKAVEAYLICDKNEEHAANYLFGGFGDEAVDRWDTALPGVPTQFTAPILARPVFRPEDAPLTAHISEEEDLNEPTATVHLKPEGGKTHEEKQNSLPMASDSEIPSTGQSLVVTVPEISTFRQRLARLRVPIVGAGVVLLCIWSLF